jgi:hypothetical protein
LSLPGATRRGNLNRHEILCILPDPKFTIHHSRDETVSGVLATLILIMSVLAADVYFSVPETGIWRSSEKNSSHLHSGGFSVGHPVTSPTMCAQSSFS